MSKVITLCGSTRFKEMFEAANADLTMKGNVVFSCGVFGHSDGIELTSDQKRRLDKVHLKKIDLSDEIYVINPGGYIGESTRREIAYAEARGKRVEYMERSETA